MQRQPEAIAAASAVASELGFLVDEVRVVYLTNRLTVRLLPCNLLARVVPPTHRDGAAFELDVARRLATAGEESAPALSLGAVAAGVREGRQGGAHRTTDPP